MSGEKSEMLGSAWGQTAGTVTERTFCVRCEDNNVVEIGCVILLDRRSAVSRGAESNTIPLLCEERLDEINKHQFECTFQTVKE